MKHPALLVTFAFLQISVRISQTIPHYKWSTLNDDQSLYIDSEHKFTWFEAMGECTMRNMSLITIDRPDKSAALGALLKTRFDKPRSIWIGGHDNGGRDIFVWSSTGKNLEFSNWGKDRPNNNKEAPNCIAILDSSNAEWYDYRCTNKLGLICEENRLVVASRKDWEVKKHFVEQLFSL